MLISELINSACQLGDSGKGPPFYLSIGLRGNTWKDEQKGSCETCFSASWKTAHTHGSVQGISLGEGS